jgi:hypothetical protein
MNMINAASVDPVRHARLDCMHDSLIARASARSHHGERAGTRLSVNTYSVLALLVASPTNVLDFIFHYYTERLEIQDLFSDGDDESKKPALVARQADVIGGNWLKKSHQIVTAHVHLEVPQRRRKR